VALTEQDIRHMRIFHPWALDHIQDFEKSGRPFVYYTQCNTALQIIKHGEFWMRDVRYMNDFREVRHGLDCLRAAYKSDEGDGFRSVLDSLHCGIAQKAMDAISQDAASLCESTFAICVSEHGDELAKEGDAGEEDQHGRLSMWRGYGGSTGVALLLNPAPFFYSGSSKLSAYASPVAYIREDGFRRALTRIRKAMEMNPDYLASLGPDATLKSVVNMFRFSVVCAKHPGFREEREWRVIWTCSLGEPRGIIHSTVDFPNKGGTQSIYRIPIASLSGIPEATVSEFIKGIIIGPCEDPVMMRQQLSDALAEAGVLQPRERIVVSDIPFRHS
jgi:hypothetical protein